MGVCVELYCSVCGVMGAGGTVMIAWLISDCA